MTTQRQGYSLARAELIHALTAYTGITTADGAVTRDTLIDANLIGSNDFITEKTIIIQSGPANNEDKAAVSFNPATGQINVDSAFSAQIMAGTIFRILNISTVELDVVNILVRIGTNTDPAGTTTLFARLRQIVDTYLANGTIGLAALKTLIDAIKAQTDKLVGDVAQAADTFVFNEASALEQTMVSLVIASRAKIGGIWLDMVNVTRDTTIRVKHQIDGATYRTFETNAWVTADEDGVLITGFTAYRNLQITLQCDGAGAGNVNVPYAIV